MINEDLRKKSCEIRDEVLDAHNTAYKVGSILLEILYEIEKLVVDIVRTNDGKIASEENVLSAKNAIRLFVNKLDGDTIRGLLVLLTGAEFGDFMKGKSGAKIETTGDAEFNNITNRKVAKFGEFVTMTSGAAIDENGDAELNNIVARGLTKLKKIIANSIENEEFEEGVLGNGFKLDENGLTIDNLLVRKKAVFVEILVQSLKHVGGQVIISPASCVCKRVEGMKVFFAAGETKQEWEVGDFAKCQTFNLKNGNRYYWRRVEEVSKEANNDEHFIVLSDTVYDKSTNNDVPLQGDHISQLGNDNNKERQNAIILSAYGEDAPSIKQFENINSFSTKGKSAQELSPKGNKFKGTFTFNSGEDVDKTILTAKNEAINQANDNINAKIEASESKILLKVNTAGSLMDNLFEDSNKEMNATGYLIGKYGCMKNEKQIEEGKIYTLAVCWTSGEKNYPIQPHWNRGSQGMNGLKEHGAGIKGIDYITIKAIEQKYNPTEIYFFGVNNESLWNDGTIIHWATIVEGETPLLYWKNPNEKNEKRIANAETKIEQNEKEIEIKAQEISNLGEDIASIKTQAEQIKLAVEHHDGVNLLEGSQNARNWPFLNYWQVDFKYEEYEDGTSGGKIEVNGKKENYFRLANMLTNGEEQTISIDVKKTKGNGQIKYCCNWPHQSEQQMRISDEWARICVSAKMQINEAYKKEWNFFEIELVNDSITEVYEIEIRRPKLERGLIATPWTITTKDSISAIKITNDKISNEVSRIENNLNNYSTIQQTTDKISAAVTEIEFIGENLIQYNKREEGFDQEYFTEIWLENNKYYTLTQHEILAECGNIYLSIVNSKNETQQVIRSWGQIEAKTSYTFIFNGISGNYKLFIWAGGIEKYITKKSFKLEKGKKGTQWSENSYDIDENIETNKSNIELTKKSIENSVSQINNKFTNYSTVQQTADEIKQKIVQWSTGENILPYGALTIESDIEKWYKNQCTAKYDTRNNTLGPLCMVYTNKKILSGIWKKMDVRMLKGKYVTISCEIAFGININAKMSVSIEALGFKEQTYNFEGNIWKRISNTYMIPETYDEVVVYACSFDENVQSFMVRNIKVEIGEKASPYTPTLEDTGIDIKNKKIVLTADNATFKTNDGKEAAVIDEEGLKTVGFQTNIKNEKKNYIKVNDNGELLATDANGIIRMRIALDANGIPNLIMYAADGNALYNIGPQGFLGFKSIESAYYQDIYLLPMRFVYNNSQWYFDFCRTNINNEIYAIAHKAHKYFAANKNGSYLEPNVGEVDRVYVWDNRNMNVPKTGTLEDDTLLWNGDDNDVTEYNNAIDGYYVVVPNNIYSISPYSDIRNKKISIVEFRKGYIINTTLLTIENCLDDLAQSLAIFHSEGSPYIFTSSEKNNRIKQYNYVKELGEMTNGLLEYITNNYLKEK